MSAKPKQPVLKSALYSDEPSSFTDLNILFKQFQPKKIRLTRTTPPVLNDTQESELYLDRSTKRLYTKINNVLVYFQGV